MVRARNDERAVKLILVTGGVISGVGKGIIASSLGVLLQAHGYRVSAIKIDPYINIDAGTFSPFEHGNVYANLTRNHFVEVSFAIFYSSFSSSGFWIFVFFWILDLSLLEFLSIVFVLFYSVLLWIAC